MSLIKKTIAQIRNLSFILFPPIEIWYTNQQIDQEKLASDFEANLDEYVSEYSGNIKSLIEEAEKTHRLELDRSARLDSKASNYLGNVGVMLSILSLAPILAVVLGISKQNLVPGIWPEFVVLLPFGYSIIALLASAYYSTKAIKIRGYSVYYTANEMKNRIQQDEHDGQEQVTSLLSSTKQNELHNLEKSNAASVAESLSRNGLIALGIGVTLIVMISFPTETISQPISSAIQPSIDAISNFKIDYSGLMALVQLVISI